jgi:hypothetical protein
MSAFNDLAGVPSSANRFTLTDVLRGEWGFKGMVVSDWDSVAQLLDHGIAADGKEAARRGFTAWKNSSSKRRSIFSPSARMVANPSSQRISCTRVLWISVVAPHRTALTSGATCSCPITFTVLFPWRETGQRSAIGSSR